LIQCKELNINTVWKSQTSRAAKVQENPYGAMGRRFGDGVEKRREEFSLDEKEIIVEGSENEKWKDTRQLSHKVRCLAFGLRRRGHGKE